MMPRTSCKAGLQAIGRTTTMKIAALGAGITGGAFAQMLDDQHQSVSFR
jgi:hypothetical protein